MNAADTLASYRLADADNTSARAALIEAIAEARREAADPHNHETTRAYWQQKARRWQANLAQTRALALNRTMQANSATSDQTLMAALLSNLKMMTDLAEAYGVGEDCDGNIIEAREVIARAEGRT